MSRWRLTESWLLLLQDGTQTSPACSSSKTTCFVRHVRDFWPPSAGHWFFMKQPSLWGYRIRKRREAFSSRAATMTAPPPIRASNTPPPCLPVQRILVCWKLVTSTFLHQTLRCRVFTWTPCRPCRAWSDTPWHGQSLQKWRRSVCARCFSHSLLPLERQCQVSNAGLSQGCRPFMVVP